MSQVMKFDNDQSESNLCKALGAVLNTQIKLITNCSIRAKDNKSNLNTKTTIKEVIIVVGSEKIYLFNTNFKIIQFEFSYSDIEYVLKEVINEDGLMINLKNVVFNNNPEVPYIYITLNDRESFINLLKCYYSTFYEFHYGEIRELVVKVKDFIEFEYNKIRVDMKKSLCHFPPKNYGCGEKNNYKFFIENNFIPLNKKREDEVFSSSINEAASEENNSKKGSNFKDNDELINAEEEIILNDKINESINIKHSNNNGVNNNSEDNMSIDYGYSQEFNSEKQDIILDAFEVVFNKNEEFSNCFKNYTNFDNEVFKLLLKSFCLVYYDIEENIPISKLNEYNHPFNRIDITALNKAVNIVEKKLGASSYYVTNSSYYIKRLNIVEDIATWDGWRIEICIFNQQKIKLVFTLLRRKFIPPFFEFSTDISVYYIIKYPKSLSHSDFLKCFKQEIFYLDKNYDLILDSFHITIQTQYVNLKNVLLSKIDSLAVDSETLWFLRSKLDIFGEEVFLLGMEFVYYCFELLSQTKIIKIFENKNYESKDFGISNSRILHTEFNKLRICYLNNECFDLKNKFDFFPSLKHVLSTRFNGYCNSNSKFDKYKNDLNDTSKLDLDEMMKKFKSLFTTFHDVVVKDSKAEIDNENINRISIIWEERVTKYLLYCLDGGLTNDFINLEFIFESLNYEINYNSSVKDNLNYKNTYFTNIILKFLCPQMPLNTIKQLLTDTSKLIKQDLYLPVLCKVIRYYGLHELLNIDNTHLNGELINLLLEKYLCYEIVDSLNYFISNYINVQYKYPLQVLFNNSSAKLNKKNLNSVHSSKSRQDRETLLLKSNGVENHNDNFQSYSLVEKELRIKVEAYLKKFHDIKKGLIKIFQNNLVSPLIQVPVAQILINLCNFDSSLSIIPYLLSNDIINIITKKLSTPLYTLYSFTVSLLFILSFNIKQTNSNKLIQNNNLFIEINSVISTYEYRDTNKIVIEELLKCLCNILAADLKNIQLIIFDLCPDSNIIIPLKDKSNEMNMTITNNTKTITNKSSINFSSYEFKTNNLPYNLLFILQQELESFDYLEEFTKQVEVDTLISRFFSLFIKQNNQHKLYLLKNLSLFQVLNSKINSIIAAYEGYQRIFDKKETTVILNSEIIVISTFKLFLNFLSRFFFFIYVLFDNNKVAFDYFKNKSVFNCIDNLFTALHNTKNCDYVKGIGDSIADKKLLDEYLSSLFSMERLIYPPEEDIDAQLEEQIKKK